MPELLTHHDHDHDHDHDHEATATATAVSISVAPDPTPDQLRPTEKVGLRIPRRLLLVAKTKWTNGGDRVQQLCQELLEEALKSRAQAAYERAIAYANRSTGSLPDPLLGLVPVRDTDLAPLTVQLSPYAVTIARQLGLADGGSALSVQKICEPLLCAELKQRRDEAVAAAENILKTLKEIDSGDPGGGSVP